MSGQEQRRHPNIEDSVESQLIPAHPQADHGRLEDVDALLDDIDSVLATNATEFVRGFVQKGGE